MNYIGAVLITFAVILCAEFMIKEIVVVVARTVRATIYTLAAVEKSVEYNFTYHNDSNGGLISDDRIEVHFSDGASAKVAGSFTYECDLLTVSQPSWNSRAYIVEHLIKPRDMALRQTAALMSSWEFYSHRHQEFSSLAKREISDDLEPWGIRISNFVISEITDYSPEMQEIIKQKIEELYRNPMKPIWAKRDLEIAAAKAIKYAERAKIAAEINGEQMRCKIVAQNTLSLSPKIEQWKAANEAWRNFEQGDIVPAVHIK